MTKKQKRILTLLGGVNIIVIMIIAGIIIKSMQTPPPPQVARIEPCTQQMLAAFPQSQQPVVSWTTDQLHVTLQITAATYRQTDDNEQYLWTVIEKVSGVFHENCPTPKTVTLSITAKGEDQTDHYLAQLAGTDLEAWIAGELPDETLALRSRYREFTAFGP